MASCHKLGIILENKVNYYKFSSTFVFLTVDVKNIVEEMPFGRLKGIPKVVIETHF